MLFITQTHYVDLWVGCPEPQRQTVIVDTGSGLTAFPCSGCQNCGAADEEGKEPHPGDGHHSHIDRLYHPEESQCFQAVTCRRGNMHSKKVEQGLSPAVDSQHCGIGKCPFSRTNPKSFPPWYKHTIDTPQDEDICQLSTSYAEGSSWSAVESTDLVYTGGSHFEVDKTEEVSAAIQLRFGCELKVTGLFETQLADGIMGMMRSPESYWSQLFHAGKIQRRQFSLCLSKADIITYLGAGAGAMVLGDSDSRLHETAMVYAEMLPSEGEQSFHLKLDQIDMRMNGGPSIIEQRRTDQEVLVTTVDLDDDKDEPEFSVRRHQRTFILDSGSTNSYLPSSYKQPFEAAFSKATGGLKYNVTYPYRFENGTSLDDVLPTFIFHIKAWQGDAADNATKPLVQVAFPPSRYMRYLPSRDAYQARLMFRQDDWKPASLGANFMTGKDVFFDMEKERIGFAESECDYLTSLGDQRFNHSMEAFEEAWARLYGDSDDAGKPLFSLGDGSQPISLVVIMALVGCLVAIVLVRRSRNRVSYNQLTVSDVGGGESELVGTSLNNTKPTPPIV